MINKKNLIFPSDDDEMKLFVSKTCDIYTRAFNTGRCFFTKFLTPLEQSVIQSRFPKNEIDISFFGGYDDSERCIAKFSAGDFGFGYEEPYPICALVIKQKNKEVFSHRDYLGSVLGLGIKREMIGDIVIRNEDAVMFCLGEIAPFIEDNLFKVGNAGVSVRCEENPDSLDVARKYENLSLNVSSMRSDCMVSALCNASRSAASELIERGLVTLNYEILQSNSRSINPGDVISVRGKGKFKIGSDIRTTKKGRLHIDAFKYV